MQSQVADEEPGFEHYNFDWDRSQEALEGPAAVDQPPDNKYVTRSFIPAPVRFNGMPDTRWWAFEDGKTNVAYKMVSADYFTVLAGYLQRWTPDALRNRI